MRVQREYEDIDDYVQALQILAKECCFKAVNATQNWDDGVRHDFIDGLSFNSIR